MRFGILIGIAVVAGGLATVAVPASFLQSAGVALHGFAGQVAGFRWVDLNPIRASFDYTQAKIQQGQTPESLGFKSAPVTVPSFSSLQPQQGYNPGFQNSQTYSPPRE